MQRQRGTGMSGYGEGPYGEGGYGGGSFVPVSSVLPREQLVQRHDACVSAPGVILWSSTTNLATCEVTLTNEVEEGEVEEAQMAPPEWFWTVAVGIPPGGGQPFGEWDFGEDPFGAQVLDLDDAIYQDRDDLDNAWFVPDGLSWWGEGNNEDGVYP